jgi:hypothetical protein
VIATEERGEGIVAAVGPAVEDEKGGHAVPPA